MRKWIALICLVSLATAGSVLAQVDDSPDGIGLYYDLGATEYCRTGVSAQTNLYLLATNLSQPSGLSGWEAHVTYTVPTGCFETGWTLPTGSLNVSAAPDFVVGLGEPAPWAPAILLATYGILVFCPDCIEFYVGPCNTPSIPGVPVYAAGDDPGLLLPLQQSSGSSDLPVLQINCDPCTVVGNETSTFGGVKSMYR
jgi:hypothetical protein